MQEISYKIFITWPLNTQVPWMKEHLTIKAKVHNQTLPPIPCTPVHPQQRFILNDVYPLNLCSNDRYIKFYNRILGK